MAWQRMQSEQEKRNEEYKRRQEQIRGFFPFIVGAVVEGTLEAARIKPDGKGFFLIRATAPCTVNVRDEDSKTGQGTAQPGQLVGIRKTGASKILSEIEIGKLVRIEYLGQEEKMSYNPKTRQQELAMYHNIEVCVYYPQEKAA
jgi:hypothetical protein